MFGDFRTIAQVLAIVMRQSTGRDRDARCDVLRTIREDDDRRAHNPRTQPQDASSSDQQEL